MAEHKADGHVRPATPEDMVPGAVVRMVSSEGTASPYSDMTVLRRTAGGWRVARPYLYAHVIGTSATALLGTEELEVSEASLGQLVTVLQARGQPFSYLMGISYLMGPG